jgi:hypothetical protein
LIAVTHEVRTTNTILFALGRATMKPFAATTASAGRRRRMIVSDEYILSA